MLAKDIQKTQLREQKRKIGSIINLIGIVVTAKNVSI